MYTIIGNENCPRCDKTKEILEEKGIEFDYFLMDSLEPAQRETYMNLAKEYNVKNFPLIIKNNTIYNLQEVIS